MSIIAIDPGTTNTGLVYMDGRRIIDAKTIHFYGAIKDDQRALMERAGEIADRLARWAYDKDYGAIVIEGFVGFTRRQSSYTFQTPYLCGYLHAAMRDWGRPIVIQTSRQVLNTHIKGNAAAYKSAIAEGRDVWGDCSMLRNDHVRSAAAHGIYYYLHKGE